MNFRILLFLWFGLGVNAMAQTPLESDFTYQGSLTLNGASANGVYDFDMYLYDAANAGNELGQYLAEDVAVNSGFFNISLDFGDLVFSGDQVWMEIRIREGMSVGGFQQMLPRQKINSTPYAIHAQFVGSNSIGTLEIQDGSITGNKLAVNAVTSDKIDGGAVNTIALAPDAVNSDKIEDMSISEDDIANNAIGTNKISNGAITQDKLSANSVGAAQIITSEVQRRITGGCSQGQYVASVNEDGSIQCIDAIDTSTHGVCKTSAGNAGIIINGVCILSYSNQSTNNWNTAVNSCSVLGGDLCSVSQYQAIRNKSAVVNLDLFYSSRPVWSNDFSDNDSGTKNVFLNSSDDPSGTQQYGYACCGNVLPEPVRTQATVVNGVNVTYLHEQQDTTWVAASNVCTSRSSDLCSKSQYVALNDANLFDTSFRKATDEMSGNDSSDFDAVVGTNTGDNSSATDLFAYACCGMSNKPVNLSCPGTVTAGGICIGTVHDTEDTNFFDAARACHNEGANLCSKSQMQSIRTEGLFSAACWTKDGADNDSSRVGGLLSSQPDNPDPLSDDFGFACCY